MRKVTRSVGLVMAIFLAIPAAKALAADKVPEWAPVPTAPGWKLEKGQTFSYEALVLPTGPLSAKQAWHPLSAETLEGKIWAGRFSPGKEGTVLKERREVEHALTKAGLQMVWSCENASCTEDKRRSVGSANIVLLKGWNPPSMRYDNSDTFWMASWKGTLKVGGQDKGFGLVSIVGYTDYRHEPSVTFYVVETKPFEATAKLDASSIGQALVKDGKIALPVNFDLDQSTLRPDGLRLLADAAEALRANKDIKVRIDGHTDAQGSAEHNQKLSLARAESVKTILVTSGIAADRLNVQGLGSSQPVAKGNTEADHAKNRRVELVVVK
ncbi:MAG: OmpA family protein [Pseudomonadota bacterium]